MQIIPCMSYDDHGGVTTDLHVCQNEDYYWPAPLDENINNFLITAAVTFVGAYKVQQLITTNGKLCSLEKTYWNR